MSIDLYRYKAVFFDAADTLLTIDRVEELLQTHLAKKSYEVSLEKIAEAIREAMRKFYLDKEKNPSATCSPESDRLFWVELYRYGLTKLGVERIWNEAEILACAHEMYDLYMDPKHYRLFDDVRDSLRRLREAGFRLGLISNFSPALREILDNHGIAGYFDPLIISTEVGLEKPNPAIFQLALEQADLRPEEMLYIGDHEVNDIWAPAQLGIDAVKIKRYPHQRGEGITSLFELFADRQI